MTTHRRRTSSRRGWRILFTRRVSVVMPPRPPEPLRRPDPANASAPTRSGSRSSVQLQPSGGGEAAVWREVLEQSAVRLIELTERALPVVDGLERKDVDPDLLGVYYEIDHFIARVRAVARDQRVLADVMVDGPGGQDHSLLSVVRWATSSVEAYDRVVIGPVPDIAVAAGAGDDVASLVAALVRNATQHSRPAVRVSAHRSDDGTVTVRIDDDGYGFRAGEAYRLTRILAGPPLPLDTWVARHSGLPVVHRAARRHGITVELFDRQRWANSPAGTTALVILPASILRTAKARPQLDQPYSPPATPDVPRHAAAGRSSDAPARRERERGVPLTGGTATVNGLPIRPYQGLPGPRTASAEYHRTDADRVASAQRFATDLAAFPPTTTPGADPVTGDGTGAGQPHQNRPVPGHDHGKDS